MLRFWAIARKIIWLKPLDFYLWVHFKIIVYARAVNEVAELQQRVEYECELIRNKPVIFRACDKS
jgi:hypothetical protein